MIVAVIPARGGSKRLPGKNLAHIGGSTLLALAIKCAQEVDEIDIIAVSTDCQDIAAEAFRYGAVVIPRPAELATDDATSESVALHSAKVLNLEPDEWDRIILLQPTSPLRIADDVKAVMAGFDPCFYTCDDQLKPNGLAYNATVEWLQAGRKFSHGRGIITSQDRAIDIDTADDLARAQEWWARRAVA